LDGNWTVVVENLVECSSDAASFGGGFDDMLVEGQLAIKLNTQILD